MQHSSWTQRRILVGQLVRTGLQQSKLTTPECKVIQAFMATVCNICTHIFPPDVLGKSALRTRHFFKLTTYMFNVSLLATFQTFSCSVSHFLSLLVLNLTTNDAQMWQYSAQAKMPLSYEIEGTITQLDIDSSSYNTYWCFTVC